MTIRSFLLKKKRLYFGMSVAVLIIGAITVQSTIHLRAHWPFYVVMGLVALGFFFYFLSNYRVLCPRCKGNIGKGYGLLLGSIENCPFCGVPLDTSLGA
jgi:hypothetical protein